MNAENDTIDVEQGHMPSGSGLYVDIENLQPNGQAMIERLVENWPDKAPPPSRLCLYVRADQVELWRLWAVNKFPDLEVVVNGTQHFSMSATKNSADIAIATNAMADFIRERVTNVVVFSNDSDFVSLYTAIRNETKEQLQADGKVPFLWVVTDREDSLSTTVKQFFPPDQLHVVTTDNLAKRKAQTPSPSTSKGKDSENSPKRNAGPWTEVAEQILREIQIGQFKSTDCQPIVKKLMPNHPVAKAGGAAFGTEFKNNIWPILEARGAKINNPGKSPVRYEMTQEAKSSLKT